MSKRSNARCFRSKGWSITGDDGWPTQDDAIAGAAADREQARQVAAAIVQCSEPLGDVCADAETVEVATVDRAIRSHMARAAERRIVARLDHDGRNSPIRLCRNVPPEQAAALIVLLARQLKSQAACGRVPSAFEAVATVAEVAGEEMASTLHQARNLLASDRAHYGHVMGTSPIIVDGVYQSNARRDQARQTSLPTNEAGIVVRRKLRTKRLDGMRVETERLRDTCDKALDAFRYFDGPEPAEKSQRVALLMLGLRNQAEEILREGEKFVPDEPTEAEEAVWWGLSDAERNELVERQENFTLRWRANSADEIRRTADKAVDAFIARHPDLKRYFNPVDPADRERDPQRFDEQRAAVKGQIRKALLEYRKKREPNPGTQALDRLRRTRRLHEIWALPVVETISRDDEARLLLPIAQAIGCPPEVRKGGRDTKDPGLEAMKRAIQRGIEARETRAGMEPERKGLLQELPPPPEKRVSKPKRASTTRRVLDGERARTDTPVHESTGTTAQAPRQTATPDRTLQSPRRR